jgi:hypothetical protein
MLHHFGHVMPDVNAEHAATLVMRDIPRPLAHMNCKIGAPILDTITLLKLP